MSNGTPPSGPTQGGTLRRQILAAPVVAGAGFAVILVIVVLLGVVTSGLLETIENGFVPGVKQARDIADELGALQQTLENSGKEQTQALIDCSEDLGGERCADTIVKHAQDLLAEAAGNLALDADRIAAIQVKLEDYYEIARPASIRAVSEGFTTEVLASIEQMRKLHAELTQQVSGLTDESELTLATKLADLKRQQTLVAGSVAAVAALSIFLIYLSAKRVLAAVSAPIGQAIEVADQLAKGNMDATVETDRSDEVGQLLRSMHHMLLYLREMANVAESIATGDLRVQIEPSSDVDLFGRSFRDMSENLREMIGRVKEAASEVAKAASEIAESSGEITRGAESQSASAEETLSTMVEIAAQIDSVAKSSQALAVNVDETSSSIQEMGASIEQVAKNSTNLLASVDETSATIEEMAASIQSIEGKVRVVDDVSRDAAKIAEGRGAELSKTIASIGGASKDIGKIVGIIEDIADQTNLLALNAAIEAAHAGDAGRGFAVVAEEVKRLAERSVSSTREIGTVVDNVQKATEEAIVLTRDILKQIVESVTRTSELVTEVYAATQEQSSGAAQILSTSNHMQSVTRQLAAAAREQASGARDMMKAVEVMNRMTQQVADASSEQKQGGDLVVKAVERIAQIAQQNLAGAEQLSRNTHNLSQEAERLLSVAEVFTLGDGEAAA